MTTEVNTDQFGKLRQLLWPIHRTELRKFIPMLLMYALIVFNYSMLKTAKDALVVTANNSGAEVIPFIKLWAILPMAIAFTFLFTRLSNKFNRERVFYIMTGIFLGFFALFAFVLYPFREYLHPNELANTLENSLPSWLSGAKWIISVFRNWSFTLFYVMSELWGTMIMTVLFWGFANEVSSVKVAKRFYSILGVGANLATVGAGYFAIFVSQTLPKLDMFKGGDHWRRSIELTIIVVLISGVGSVAIYYWMNRNVFKSCPHGFQENGEPIVKKREKMSLRKSFSTLAKSKYLLCIAVLVIAFNVGLTMVEIVWKDQLHALYPNPSDYHAYYSKVMVWIGIFSTITALCFTGNVIRKFGWTVSALVTPVILFITGILFFSFILFKDGSLGSMSLIFGTTPLALGIFFGSMQNVLSRTCKFTFFDATKEMSFIPLDPETKLKGKAAIDGVGSRLGKSGGSAVHSLLIFTMGSVSLSTPIIGGLLLVVVIGWMMAVKNLGVLFGIKSAETDVAQNALPNVETQTV